MEKITLLENKRIILAVTGSIAVYKAVDLASKLTQSGAQVDVVMTDAARRFAAPISFQSVTGRPVYTDMWQSDSTDGLPTHIAHIGLGEGADLLVVAPVTANTLAKLAQGIADNLLSVTALAVRCPLVVAPAMDGGMYSHPATQANIRTLVERGAYFIEPDEGRFASGLYGKGRFPDTHTLMGHIRRALGQNGTLAGRKIIVTAGGTREPIDPVRYIANHSSGKQGYALAQAALDAGADVVLISTVRSLPVPVGATFVSVDTVQSMLEAVLDNLPVAHALLMAAAGADFRPATVVDHKIKKTKEPDALLTLQLELTPDILMAVKAYREENGYPRISVGFAAESEDLLANARGKLERKGLDLIVANDITAPDAGFAVDTNRVVILDAGGGQQPVELTSKARVSEIIVGRVAELLSI